MDHSNITSQSQAFVDVQSKTDDFFGRFKIATLMHQCGVRKHHGHSVRSLTKAIFTLPFIGKNFFRGIVLSNETSFGKDAAYELLKGETCNWRRMLLTLGRRLFGIFNRLTGDDRESVLIDRSRSEWAELLASVRDHSTGRFLKGFRMLTVCRSDGNSCLPTDFALLSSSDAGKRLCGSRKSSDKRCCAYQRRKEATQKATEHSEAMVRRVLSTGGSAKYLLTDSWFTMPATVVTLARHLPVIGMAKKSPCIHHTSDGQPSDSEAICRRLKKRRGRARILAGARVMLRGSVPAKLVFVRDRRKKDWLALISADTDLADDEIVRICGKRWDIGVFFKMARQHPKLAKEIQCRDFDALIAHTSVVFMRYMFLAYQCRMQTDHRTFGDLFYACCDEVADISFMQAIYRILTLAVDRLKKSDTFCEKTAAAFFDAVMNTALQCVGLSKNNLQIG